MHTDIGDDVWMFEGEAVPYMGLNAVAGRPPEEYGIEPMAYDEMRRGCWDVHERVKDMNAGGVLASLNFPSFPGFAGRLFAAIDDKDLALAVIRAYNDWHIDEWCGAYPDRFLPMALPVLWDPELAADEVRRTAQKGCHSVTFTENPALLDYPSFHSDAWDPFWAAATDTGTVVSIHLGSGGKLVQTSADAPVDVMMTLQPMVVVPVRGRHHVVEDPGHVPRHPLRPLGGRDRLDPVLPRTHRPHLRPPPPLDRPGLRLEAPQRDLPRALPHLLHRRPRRRATRATGSASTT